MHPWTTFFNGDCASNKLTAATLQAARIALAVSAPRRRTTARDSFLGAPSAGNGNALGPQDEAAELAGGRVEQGRRHAEGAGVTLRRHSRRTGTRLAKSDPGNASWQRDLSGSYDRVGGAQVDQGDLVGALKSYRDSLAIRDVWRKSDRSNTGWQRNLAVSYSKLADVYRRSNDRDNELAAPRRDKRSCSAS